MDKKGRSKDGDVRLQYEDTKEDATMSWWKKIMQGTEAKAKTTATPDMTAGTGTQGVGDLITRIEKATDKSDYGAACRGLAAVRGKHAVQDLIRALQHRNADVVINATDALAEIGDSSAGPALLSLLKTDGRANVRCAAAITLGCLRYVDAVPSLLNALGDAEWTVRCWTALSLGFMKDDRAVGPLCSTLADDPNEHVRENAIKALGSIGGSRAIEALKRAEKDADFGISMSASQALRREEPLTKSIL
jgi:HEAT repeat protein